MEDSVKTIKEIEEIISEINGVYIGLCQKSNESMKGELANVLPKVTKYMSELVQVVIKIKEYGVDIPVEVLTAQMENLLDGFDHMDYMQMADTLYYEITDSMRLFIDIIEELEKNNIVI